MRKIKAPILCLLLLLSFNVNAKTIYLSVFGKDSNSGTKEKPFATLQFATEKLSAGDTLIILPGYYKQKVLINKLNGTTENPVVIKGIGEVIISGPEYVSLTPGELEIGNFDVSLDNPDHLYYPYYRGAIVRIQNSSFLTLEGLRIMNSPWFGIGAYQTSNLTVKFCYFEEHGASSMYILNSEYPTLAFNEIVRSNSYNERIATHGSQECISIVNTNYAEVMYNRIHESSTWFYVQYQASGVGGEGIDVKENSKYAKVHHNYVYNLQRPGLYIDAWNSLDNKGHEVFCNVVHNTQDGIALACEDHGRLEDIKIYNNLFFNNWLEGIHLAAWGHGGIKKNIQIFNNTIYNNWEGGIKLGKELHTDIVVVNNLCYMNTRYKFPDIDLGTAKNVTASNNYTEKPGFRRFNWGDFDLAEGSPCIDAGIKIEGLPDTDLYHAKRVINEKPDIGAFEFGGTPTSPRVIYVSTKGEDYNAGNFYKPYKTLQKAVEMVRPGDNIVILPGVYQEQVTIKDLKGSSEKPIMIRGKGKVIFDGQTTPENKAVISLYNCEHVILEDLAFQFARGNNISVESCKQTLIQGCTLDKDIKNAVKINASKDVLLKHLL